MGTIRTGKQKLKQKGFDWNNIINFFFHLFSKKQLNSRRPSLISSSVMFFFWDLGRLWMTSAGGSLSLSIVHLFTPSTMSVLCCSREKEHNHENTINVHISFLIPIHLKTWKIVFNIILPPSDKWFKTFCNIQLNLWYLLRFTLHLHGICIKTYHKKSFTATCVNLSFYN